MSLRTIGLALFASTFLAASARGLEETAPARSINSNGEAVVYVVPDEVIVGFGIESFDAALDKSRAANEEASGRLLKAIKDMQIEDKHIQTSAIGIEIRYKEGRHPVHGIEGYFTRRSYSVTLKDTKKTQALIDAAMKNGANQLHGIEYRTSELRKHRDQARKMAIKACREKADMLAAELGCQVSTPRTITESSYSMYGWNDRGNAFQNAVQIGAGGGGDEDGATVPLGQIAVRATVSVMFDLRTDALKVEAPADPKKTAKADATADAAAEAPAKP